MTYAAFAILLPVTVFTTLLSGNTISLSVSGSRPLVGGDDTCSITSPAAVACGIHPDFADPTGRNSAHADLSASAASGGVTGGAFVFADETNISATYVASSTNSVTVTGGSGAGTLITHWHLISTNSQFHLPGQAVSPSYDLFQDGTSRSFIALLPTTPPDPNRGASREDDLDVSSTFLFGAPFTIGAQTQGHLEIQFLNGNLSVSSSAAITGYTVLDASGAVVPGALVLSNAVPEPGTWACGLGALLLLVRLRRR